jgi:acetate kinase
MALLMGTQEQPVLALNCGSSSLKFGAYTSDGTAANPIYQGEAEEIGKQHSFPSHTAALLDALDELKEHGISEFKAVGHRFVHGGPELRDHRLLTPAVAKQLEAAVEYAPLHLPTSLAVLKVTQEKLPGVPQAICLDTAFHRHMPVVSRTYALPEKIRRLGVERYGFHGLSLESIVAQLKPVPNRLVVAHLGNGASVTAILKGISIDTSMGLTPTGGIVMGTRCGDLDPGLMVYLNRHGYAKAEQLEQVFDHESGLLGISGMSSDVRTLLKARAHNEQASLALEIFCYQARKTIASMSAALGGLDLLIFTGGIGEHAETLRDEICRGLKFLNSNGFEVKVLPSQEDEQIAKNTVRLLNQGQS